MHFNNSFNICRWRINKKPVPLQKHCILHFSQDCLCPQKIQEMNVE